jgi:predicted DNA-binding protein YlxM (UPF0122 family)
MKDIKIAILLDYYGILLTEKQYMAVDLYYNEDYSLLEIGEQLNITRQGVHENIKKGTDNLIYFEEKLKLYNKNQENEKIKKRILDLTDNNEIIELLEKI